MSGCEQRHLLEAYYDGELTPAEAARFQAHLSGCDACSAELERLVAASHHLRRFRGERLTPQQSQMLQRAVARAAAAAPVAVEDDPPTMRLAATLAVLAASVMLIGLAWLRVLTRGSTSPVPGRAVVSTTPPDRRAWERVAMTLQPDPLSLPPPPSTGDQTAAAALGEPDLADWMLQGLYAGPKMQRERTQQP